MYDHEFEWLAIVLLPGDTETKRRIFLIPRALADATARRNDPATANAGEWYFRLDEVEAFAPPFESNFNLDRQEDAWEAVKTEFTKRRRRPRTK
jgi:hypothetical protein